MEFLKIDAAAILFPIAETRRLGTGRSADLGHGLGPGRRLRLAGMCRRTFIGSFCNVGRNVEHFDGVGMRHGREFCQNHTASTT